MAALTTIPPPRTPSPKIRIRSQSFDSPSSRISVTPIDDSPYSKSTSAIAANTLPRYNVAKAADQGLILSSNVNKVILHTKMSDDSMLSTSTGTSDEDDEEDEDADSEASVSSTNSNLNPDDDSPYPLFNTVSPNFPLSPSSPSSSSSSSSPTSPISPSSPIPPAPTTFQIYQDPNTPMYDPWLVRVVLDMFDIRGLDWFMIAEPIERVWGFRTSSAEVLGILCGNGRVGRVWWD